MNVATILAWLANREPEKRISRLGLLGRLGLARDVTLCWTPAGRGLPTRAVPRRFRRAYRIENRAADLYAIAGLHLILRAAKWWGYRRWILESVLFSIGWMEGDDLELPTFRSLRYGNPRDILARRVMGSSNGAYHRGFKAGKQSAENELAREIRDLRSELKRQFDAVVPVDVDRALLADRGLLTSRYELALEERGSQLVGNAP